MDIEKLDTAKTIITSIQKNIEHSLRYTEWEYRESVEKFAKTTRESDDFAELVKETVVLNDTPKSIVFDICSKLVEAKGCFAFFVNDLTRSNLSGRGGRQYLIKPESECGEEFFLFAIEVDDGDSFRCLKFLENNTVNTALKTDNFKRVLSNAGYEVAVDIETGAFEV